MNTSSPRVLVVIVNWNGIKDTELCLESLSKQSYKNFEILVIDNGSTNNSLKRLRILEGKNDQLTVIDNKTNQGFAGGVNTGINYAIENKFFAVALFNNDAVAHTNWLEELVLTIKPDKIGIATGLLLTDDKKTIDSTGEFYSSWGLAFPRSRGQTLDSAPAPEAGQVFGATGGASLYKVELFKNIGLFDPSFFMYFEDVDISFRAQLAGWKVAYNPKAIAYHKTGASAKKVPGLTVNRLFANLPQLLLKNVPRGLFWHTHVRFSLAYFFFFWNAVLRGNGWPAFRGVLRGILMTPASLIKRRKIQRNKKVSVDYIRRIMWQDLPPSATGMRSLRKFFTGKS